jgi:hypothetical protein
VKMPTIEMAEIASILLPRQKILQTLSEESISPIDPNNIEGDYSTIRFWIALVRGDVRLRQLDRYNR